MNHTYYVEFYRKDGGVGASARVQAEGIVVAIKAAGALRADQIAAGADWGTKVTLVDTEAEAKEREDNRHLYEYATVAERLFEEYGFAPEEGMYRRNGMVAMIDHHSAGEYRRYVGLYQHRIAPDGTDVMVAFALIPWYGDGADMVTSEALLDTLLQTVTK